MISFMIALLAVCASAGLVGGLVFKKKALQKKRKTLLASDFPQDWMFFIDKNMPLYSCFPESLKKQLHGLVNVFLDEKKFVGCGGQEITDEIKVTIAAQACMLLLNRKTNFYPKLKTIYVYPHTYVAKGLMNDGGLIVEGKSVRLGESWQNGPVVLTWDSITGGARNILRSSGAHVEEMRWWLQQLPLSAQAVILENNAISPDLQPLAGRWLKPDITVFSNALPDHQEAWGPSRESAAEVLVAGVPRGGQVVLPAGLEDDDYLARLLLNRGCHLVYAKAEAEAGEAFKAVNLGLSLAALIRLGIEPGGARKAMLALPEDRYDFRVVHRGGAEFAMAFSVNDIGSTRMLFNTLRWAKEETRLVYNHRKDRPERFASFFAWLAQSPWKEVLVIGDRPRSRPECSRYLKVRNPGELLALFQPGEY